ncbi:DUF4840 domain-containing protein [Chryseobacterium herbae]|uniref:DUF4840 domain-containing protein n=1 Tax=Chryseobacterium herbae TaxID=2976476 RepID=A0ABT2IX22_9FLAO|nr:DUF4840 domain-containing protein [Chryseobacterium sp. pc1-10]MCT2563385.1 DUF4840 domain-containing protein [Chryseobacterium sp. pc1-10]
MLLILLSFTFSVTSCRDDDDKKPKPNPDTLKVQDVNGDYSGKVVISKGTVTGETNLVFSAQNNIISFTEFPIKEIITTVITDPVKANQALTAIGKIKYELNYTSALNKEKKEVELTFSPKELTIQVPVDGVNKKVVVTFVPTKKGVFKKGTTQNLNFELEATKITVEGTVITPFEKIKYNFPMLKK